MLAVFSIMNKYCRMEIKGSEGMRTYLTLDVGGSAIKYALMKEDLTLLEKSSVPTPTDTLDSFVETIGKFMINMLILLMVWLYPCRVLLILIEVINLQGELCVTLIN